MATDEEALTAVSGVVRRNGPFPELATDTKTGVLSDSVAADSLLRVAAASDSDDAPAGCVSLLSVRDVVGSLPVVAVLEVVGVAEFEVAGVPEAWEAGVGL